MATPLTNISKDAMTSCMPSSLFSRYVDADDIPSAIPYNIVPVGLFVISNGDRS